MCEHCGCRQVQPLAELMDEHIALLDLASDVEGAVDRGDRRAATDLLRHLVGVLDRHVRREEDGVFTALRGTGEFLDEVNDLERDHHAFDAMIAAVDPAAVDFAARVRELIAHLADHVEREDLGIFPVSVVTLGSQGWETVARAHGEQPSFLVERPGTAPTR